MSLLGVDSARALDVTFQLRIQDVSRQSQTWGTSIPTVRDRDAFTAPRIISLADIPMTPEFRSMLRVYDFDPQLGSAVREVKLRYYALDPGRSSPGTESDVLLLETIQKFVLHPVAPSWEPPTLSLPLESISELAAHDRIRIEIEAVTTGLRFWGFVSVTNNETQHVTVISPD